ncbi:NADP-binding protein [Dacryopinax primogenitus]|uniref:NADP-binding protein n=1 Tax=Dacryopinax primogenitus (strain DJM 731) TaxID=1858805 RepID=M5FZT7_DACPD|nr:NADP-binding protein [Dacryopinax primogenitus]EJU01405.1 NADP-binding protein [Dacryopinax primogenitus]
MVPKVVVVTGATGTQGSAVISSLLKRGGYLLRGSTRHTDSSASQELTRKGVEMVRADIADKVSLVQAFKGAYAVFGNAVFPCPLDAEVQGKNMADACKANNVPLFIWSSIPSAIQLSKGRYTDVTHWEQKHAVDEYITSVSQPSVILHLGAFLDNLFTQPYRLFPSPTPGKWTLSYVLVPGDVKMSSIWIGGDFGEIVRAVVDVWEEDGWRERLMKEPISVAGGRYSPNDVGESIARLSGQEIEVVNPPAPPGFPPHLISMFKLFSDGYYDFSGPNPPEILLDLGLKSQPNANHVIVHPIC